MADLWSEQIESHQIHGVLEQLQDAVETAERVEPLDTGAASQLRRMRAAVVYVRERLRQAQPRLTPLTSLNNAVPLAQPAIQFVQNFINDREQTHLYNANNHIDGLLIEFRWLPPISSRRESQAAVEASQHLAQSIEELETKVREKLEGIDARMDSVISESQTSVRETSASLEALRATAEASVTNLNTRIESTITQLTSEVTDQKTRLDSYFEQQQAAHLTTQQERQREFTDTMERLRETARVQVDLEVEKVRGTAVQAEGIGKGMIESLTKLEEKAKEITGVTAAAGVTGSYINEADEQRREANTWRKFAAALLVLVVLGAIATTIWSPLRGGDVTTEEIIEYGITRVPIVVVLGGVFTYAAQQSGQHRARERRARRRAMELTAFRPFIAELDTEDQHNLIKDTTKKYFKGDDDAPLPDEVGG